MSFVESVSGVFVKSGSKAATPDPIAFHRFWMLDGNHAQSLIAEISRE
jgi:hypothetical protein